MPYRSFVLVLLFSVFWLMSCDDTIPSDEEWVGADGFPCGDTKSLVELLGEEPHRDSPFAHHAARDACGRIGKVFGGDAQCTDRRIQVKCETSPDGWVDLPYLCETTNELYAMGWKLDAAETRCTRLGKVFTGEALCIDKGMKAECGAF